MNGPCLTKVRPLRTASISARAGPVGHWDSKGGVSRQARSQACPQIPPVPCQGRRDPCGFQLGLGPRYAGGTSRPTVSPGKRQNIRLEGLGVDGAAAMRAATSPACSCPRNLADSVSLGEGELGSRSCRPADRSDGAAGARTRQAEETLNVGRTQVRQAETQKQAAGSAVTARLASPNALQKASLCSRSFARVPSGSSTPRGTALGLTTAPPIS